MKQFLSLFVASLLISTTISAKTYQSDEVKNCGEALCDLSGNLITGTKKEYYKNGNLLWEIPFLNGKIEGVLKTYYENGGLKAEMPYVNGKQEGVSKSYYKNGNLEAQISVKNGQQDGLTKGYDEKGVLVLELTFEKGQAVFGFIYDEKGNKEPITNVHLYNLGKKEPEVRP